MSSKFGCSLPSPAFTDMSVRRKHPEQRTAALYTTTSSPRTPATDSYTLNELLKREHPIITMDEKTVYARKFELGIVLGGKQRGGTTNVLSYSMFRAAIAEMVGMFLFLFNVISVARFVGRNSSEDGASASIILIAFEFGLSIFVLVYMLAQASGAHLNPAVSFALLVGKRISVEQFVIYVIVQVVGAMAGAAVATTFLDSTGGGYNTINDGFTPVNAFGGEVLCTFLLVLTVFASSDGELGRKDSAAGPLAPWAIGMAVMLSHLVLVPIDECSINPARSFATAVTNNKWGDHWVFWIGPLLGGVLATIMWETILRPEQPVHSARTENSSVGPDNL